MTHVNDLQDLVGSQEQIKQLKEGAHLAASIPPTKKAPPSIAMVASSAGRLPPDIMSSDLATELQQV